MTVLSALVLIAFLIGLPLRWYQNYWMATDRFDRPAIMRSSLNQMVYMFVVFALTYGSIIGIWYFYGLWVALAALAVKMLVGRVSWKRYFHREVYATAERHYNRMLKSKAQIGVPDEQLSSTDRLYRGIMPEELHTWDDERMKREAYMQAYEEVRKRRLSRDRV